MGEVDPHVWDRFDMVAVLSYTGYQDRQPALWAELERVGLKDRVEWFWNFPSPFTERFANSIRLSGTIKDCAAFNSTMGYYRVLKTAVELGKAHVLVLEDDVRFLKDPVALAGAVASLPADYDLAKFDWTARVARGQTEIPTIEGPWAPLRGFDTRCTGAAAYSLKGARWQTEFMERPARFDDLHSQLYSHDVYHTSHNVARLHAYVACPLAAVQADGFDAVFGVPRSWYTHLAGDSLDSYGR